MAAKVASSGSVHQQQGSNGREEGPAGISYASVLNQKLASTETTTSSSTSLSCQKENNKENIGSQVTALNNVSDTRNKTFKRASRRFETQRNIPTERRLYGNYVPHNNTPAPMEAVVAIKATTINCSNGNIKSTKEEVEEVVKNGGISSDGEFQTVAPKSARRKEKLKEHRDYIESLSYRTKDRQRLYGRNGENERPFKERDYAFNSKDASRDRDKDKEKEKDAEVVIEEPEPQPVKYVEAPLPIVNPWTKSKINAVQPTPLQPALPQPRTVPTVKAVAASAIPAPATTAPTTPAPVTTAPVAALNAPVSDKSVEREKRVLQPQQQKVKIGHMMSNN